MTTTKNILAAKKALRKQIGEILLGIDENQIANETNIVINKIKEFDFFKNANIISIFVSTKGEIGTDELIRHCLDEKKEVYIPRFEKGKKQMEMLRLNNWDEFLKLDTSLWDIRQHYVDTTTKVTPLNKALDLIILPGVAFNEKGHRLGHGMGYYDRFLHQHIEAYSNYGLKKVGLALTQQLVAEIPVEEHDVMLDVILHA